MISFLIKISPSHTKPGGLKEENPSGWKSSRTKENVWENALKSQTLIISFLSSSMRLFYGMGKIGKKKFSILSKES